MSRSNEYLKNLLHSSDRLSKVIKMNEHFPCVPYYSELQKKETERLLKNGDCDTAAEHLIEAHSIGLRHTAILINKEKQKKKISKSSKTLNHSEVNEFHKHLEFQKPLSPKLLKIPNDWTVVQITEVWTSSETMSMLGFGPPPAVYKLPNLLVTRISRTSPCTVTVKLLPRPPEDIGHGSLLAELRSVIEGNKTVSKDFRGNRDQYWRMRQVHNDQLKVVVDSLENWWLDFRKCYLMGEPDDPSDAYLLNRLVSEALSVVKETKRTPSSDEETSLRLLISSHSSMINAQVVRGVMNIFGVSAKSELVTNLLAYFRTVQTELQHLKAVKRKPVFLILDKVIQQFPWESMAALSTTPTSRLPSLHFLNFLSERHFSKPFTSPKKLPTPDRRFLSNMIVVNPKRAYYVLNPGKDLPGIQQRVQPLVENIWGKDCGLCGVEPMEEQIKQSLMERDLFLYCGHGSGSKYLPSDHLLKVDCKATPILMGCSSGQLSAPGRIADPTGTAAHYLIAGSPGIVGMLWEITDVDCDRFTIRLLDLIVGARKENLRESKAKVIKAISEHIPPPPEFAEPEILRAVSASRPITKFFVTGAAAVAYGLPIRAIDY